MVVDGFIKSNTTRMVVWNSLRLDWLCLVITRLKKSITNTFAQVAKMTTFRTFLAIAAKLKVALNGCP